MRKIVASLAMLVFICIWIALAVKTGESLADSPRWVQLIFYVVAGIGWIAPMKPLFAWMNAGAHPEQDE